MRVQKIAILGVGLIGGSLAAAWRASQFAGSIVGIDADSNAAQSALQAGLVDEIMPRVPADADLIAVCTSATQIAQCVSDLRGHGGVIFDVGSVKEPIIQALEDHKEGVPAQFVPAHPIAGSELSGPKAAQAALFEGATVIITPLENTAPAAKQLVRDAWCDVGASVIELTPAEHDEVLAVTSHLPHLLSYAFMLQVEDQQMAFGGGGFRDFTRIAGANPDLWWQILSLNKDQVLGAAGHFESNFKRLIEALVNDDRDAGLRLLRDAAGRRISAASESLHPGADK